MKVKVLKKQPEYVDHTLKAGEKFYFAESSGRDNRPCMALQVVQNARDCMAWTPLEGPDVGIVFRFSASDTLILL